MLIQFVANDLNHNRYQQSFLGRNERMPGGTPGLCKGVESHRKGREQVRLVFILIRLFALLGSQKTAIGFIEAVHLKCRVTGKREWQWTL